MLACWPARPAHFRKPDGMFFAKGRLPGDRPPEGTIDIAPDLAVDVVSPSGNARNLETKVAEYLEAGVRLVWVFYPDSSTVHVYRRGSAAARLGPADMLDGEDVLPGFSVPVAEVFDTSLQDRPACTSAQPGGRGPDGVCTACRASHGRDR